MNLSRPQSTLAQDSAVLAPAVVWVVAAVLLVTVLCLCVLRFVPAGQHLVVFRFGGSASVRGPGVVALLPGIHRAVRVRRGPDRLALPLVDAVTADGVGVAVSGSVLVSVVDPEARARSSGSPEQATQVAAETELRRHVGRIDLAALYRSVQDEHSALAVGISERTRGWGTEVELVELTGVEVRLTADLISWAENLPTRKGVLSMMDVERTTVPGTGVVHHFLTSSGQQLGVLVERTGKRRLLVYGSADLDAPSQSIMLDADEAGQIAELLHTRSVDDRLDALERRINELSRATGQAPTAR